MERAIKISRCAKFRACCAKRLEERNGDRTWLVGVDRSGVNLVLQMSKHPHLLVMIDMVDLVPVPAAAAAQPAAAASAGPGAGCSGSLP